MRPVGSPARRPAEWPWAWRHFDPLGPKPGWPGHPFCHTDQDVPQVPVAQVHELSRISPMIALSVWQARRCALCGGEVPLDVTVADHSHVTGLVRGLLCQSCNTRERDGFPRSATDLPCNQALVRYLDHPVTAMLGLRIRYSDTPGWRSAVAAHEERALRELQASIERTRERDARVAASFTCPVCGRTSHHPTDVAEGYCGACHDWPLNPALL